MATKPNAIPIDHIGVGSAISSKLQQVQDENNYSTPLWISNAEVGVFGNGGKDATATFYISSYNPAQVTGSKGDAAIVATDQGNGTAVVTFKLQPVGGTSPSLTALRLSPDGGVALPSLRNLPKSGYNLLGVDQNGNLKVLTIAEA